MRKIEVTALDDLTGEPAESMIVFAHRGRWFEIDLAAANADEVTALLDRWSAAGREVDGPVGGAAGGRRTQADRERGAAIRAWAVEHGHPVAAKGRIPVAVITAYDNRAAQAVPALRRGRTTRT